MKTRRPKGRTIKRRASYFNDDGIEVVAAELIPGCVEGIPMEDYLGSPLFFQDAQRNFADEIMPNIKITSEFIRDCPFMSIESAMGIVEESERALELLDMITDPAVKERFKETRAKIDAQMAEVRKANIALAKRIQAKMNGEPDAA